MGLEIRSLRCPTGTGCSSEDEGGKIDRLEDSEDMEDSYLRMGKRDIIPSLI